MKITIITINYNNLDGLKKTFESVFKQTYKDLEYIVIDGGSTDGSKEYIENHKDKIFYWESEKDNGVYHAMNKGILKSTGEYLNFMNSGDWFYENVSIEKAMLNVNNEDIIYGNTKYFNKVVYKDFILPEKLDFSFFYKHSLCHQASFIKKELFEKYEMYDERFKIVSDWKFFAKCVCIYKVSTKYVNEFLCYYDFTGISSIKVNLKKVESERLVVFKEEFKEYYKGFERLEILNEKRVKQFLYIKNNKPIRWKLIKFALNLLRAKAE